MPTSLVKASKGKAVRKAAKKRTPVVARGVRAVRMPAPRPLGLRDRLSRLTFTQACKLLGKDGKALMNRGARYNIGIGEQVSLAEQVFQLRLPSAEVSIGVQPGTTSLVFLCSACRGDPCEHVAAAFSLILEHKLALGLARPPRERTPVESLSEEELRKLALQERQERSKSEPLEILAPVSGGLWDDYQVRNRQTGQAYRVALRGWEYGQSYCSCPDFRCNTLGTCKHVMAVVAKVGKTPAARRADPYRPRLVCIHLAYVDGLRLAAEFPDGIDPEAKRRVTAAIHNGQEADAEKLVEALRHLAAKGIDHVVYPDAEEYIQMQLFRRRMAALVAEIRADPARHPLRCSLLKAELLPYQLDGIAFAAGQGRAVLADDMGLGKTIQGIGVAELLARQAGIGRVLVVTPTSLKSQWLNEIARFSGRSAQIAAGPARERADQYAGDAFFTLCNYEQVLRDLRHIGEIPWDLIILDEGQRIKNWESKTSRVVKSLKSRFALVLSGTPLENRLEELFSVMQFIDEGRLGPAFRFLNRHRVADDRGATLGYKNLDELRKRLRPVLLRRTRSEVAVQLPGRTTEIVRIFPTKQQMEAHADAQRQISQIVKKSYISEMDLLRLQKFLLICRMAADSTALVDKRMPGFSSKLEELDNLFEEIAAEPDRKVVLFSEWTSMLDLIEPLLERRGLRFVRLDGQVPQKKRQALVDEFQNDPRCAFFLTTNAGSTGLNLQAANTVINVDLPWNPAILEQRIARAHRMGQKRQVQVFLLVTANTIEERLLATLSAKADLALAALDPASKTDAVNLVSGIEELKKRLEELIGRQEPAPADVRQQEAVAREAEELARRQKIAAAGGRFLQSAFELLGQAVPAVPAGDPVAEQTAAVVRSSLESCVRKTEDGRLQITLDLPDPAALTAMAEALARIMFAAQAHPPKPE